MEYLNTKNIEKISDIAKTFELGFRKIRNFCDSLIKKEQIVETETKEKPKEAKRTEGMGFVKLPNSYYRKYLTPDKMLEHEFRDMCNRKETLSKFYDLMLHRDFRCDRFKNVWVYKDSLKSRTDKTAWAKLPPETMQLINQNLQFAWDHMSEYFRKNQKPEDVDKYVWSRGRSMRSLDMKVPLDWFNKSLRSVLEKNHRAFGSMR